MLTPKAIRAVKGRGHHPNVGLAMTLGGPRSRRLVEQLRVSGEAMAAARPFRRELARLDAEIADLRRALDSGNNHADRPEMFKVSESLRRAVYGEQVAFADLTVSLANSVAANDRINDTRLALDSTASDVEGIQTELARHLRRDRAHGLAK